MNTSTTATAGGLTKIGAARERYARIFRESDPRPSRFADSASATDYQAWAARADAFASLAPVAVRFNGDEFTTGSFRDYNRALRVALRGLHAEWGRFAGGVAEIIDAASGEVIETIEYLDEKIGA